MKLLKVVNGWGIRYFINLHFLFTVIVWTILLITSAIDMFSPVAPIPTL